MIINNNNHRRLLERITITINRRASLIVITIGNNNYKFNNSRV